MVKPALTVVGHCTTTTAKVLGVFGENDSPKNARIVFRVHGKYAARDVTTTPAPPYTLGRFEVGGLAASASVEYWVVGADQLDPFAEADVAAFGAPKKFNLLPLPNQRPLRIGLVSCNGAPSVPRQGEYRLWETLKEQIERQEVDVLIHAGDQIYADPIRASHHDLKALTPTPASIEELAKEYRRFYMRVWKTPQVADVLASCPNIMMWDDHDIYDGWGSNDGDSSAPARTVFEGAAKAFDEFQCGNNPPRLGTGSRACGFDLGKTGVLVLDGRTHRLYRDSRVLGDQQLQEVDLWLNAMTKKGLDHLFVVSGIPFVHAPAAAFLKVIEWTPWTEEITDDLRDCWTAPRNQAECRRILMRLFQFAKNSKTRVTVLAGDVHVGTIAKIESSIAAHAATPGVPAYMYQVVSSGIGTPAPTGIKGWFLKHATDSRINLVGGEVGGCLQRLDGVGCHLLAARNFATIKTEDRPDTRPDPHGNVYVRFFAEDWEGVVEHEQCLLGSR